MDLSSNQDVKWADFSDSEKMKVAFGVWCLVANHFVLYFVWRNTDFPFSIFR